MKTIAWIGCLAFLALAVKGASVVKRSTGSGKKVVRHGDELFLVDVDDDDDNQTDGDQPRTSGKEKRSIRVGNELILLDDDDDERRDDEHRINKRAAVKDESYRWKEKTVPYLFDSTFDAKDQGIVREAMDEWSRYTCVMFRPARASDSHRIKFVQGDGCFSFVGQVDEKTQEVSLDKDGCRFVSTALHEIGHALGMYHTQVRPDRDRYIKIDLSDVANKLQDNFQKQTWDTAHHYGVDYDFNSIMHYDGTSFTSNGGTSIKTLDPKWQKIIGNAKHLSFGDIEMMNKMYHCAPKTCGLKDADCPGTSFVDQTCKCVCPGPSATNRVVPCSGATNNNNNRGGTGGSQPSSTGNGRDSQSYVPTDEGYYQGGQDWGDDQDAWSEDEDWNTDSDGYQGGWEEQYY